ncbi:hypothetical protein [Symbiobacterium thermophilum]|uniref:Uncharacterized protein n=1 Tax=Symbiobacterium thermophilum (strain DSM 24528 / JCM 14929 / IAM 14863 / T) TaxID=292459 RepID=Q67SU0_SYMTH|nr:hypothetical protein [Symbiobacterium thermophilum]BAD39253.1 hypothetical protein STH268 [Symbiobacterium thermophilum IAM 14863]
MITRIEYVVCPTRLVPDAPYISQLASADALADLIRKELRAAYPAAEVVVRVARLMEMLAPDACLQVVAEDGCDQDARLAVEQIIQSVCTDRQAEWIIIDRTEPMLQSDVAAIAENILRCHLGRLHPPGTIHSTVREWASRIISDPSYAETLAEVGGEVPYHQLTQYQAGITALVSDLCHDLVRFRRGEATDLAPAIIWAYERHLSVLTDPPAPSPSAAWHLPSPSEKRQ